MPDAVAPTSVIPPADPSSATEIPNASFRPCCSRTPTASSDQALAIPSTPPQSAKNVTASGNKTTTESNVNDNAAIAACHRGVLDDGPPVLCPFILAPCLHA